MPIPTSHEAAMQKAIKCHGELYDLTAMVYTKNMEQVLVGCRKHGIFSINFRDFTKKVKPGGCQACSKELYAESRVESPNKINESDAIRRMLKKHSGKFDYSEVIYTGYMREVVVICKEHGKFNTTPLQHVSSQHGCLGCANASGASARQSSRNKNISKAIILHGDFYDYSCVPDNICSKTAFDIVCKLHGNFSKTWNEHNKGGGKGGCPKCSAIALGNKFRSNTADFIEKANKIHAQRYEYSLVNYIGGRDNVEIGCRIHGSFMQMPNKHLSGRGCNACAKNGYRTARPGYLYLFQDGDITKVGITNRKVATRLTEINYSGKQFAVIHSQKYESGKSCINAETALLKYLKGMYKPCNEHFNGSTECFMKVDLEDLMNKFEAVAEL